MRKPGAKEEYISSAFPVEDSILKKIRERLERDTKDGIQVGQPDARILQFLIRLIAAKKIVEIGTLYGYSSYAMAMAMPEGGKIWTLDSNSKHHQAAKELLDGAGAATKIEFVIGDAKETLAQVQPNGPFDIVFIDANKNGYLDYLNWAEANTRVGGLIIGDNTFLFDSLFGESRDANVGVKQQQTMREFNRRLGHSDNYNSCLVPTGEGMTVAQKLRVIP